MKEFKTINVQAALFTAESIKRPDMLYYKVLSELDDVFDQQPNINNMPDMVPAEIPRVISVSTDNRYQINISKNRVDLFINFNREDEDDEINYAHFKSITNTLCKQISQSEGVSRIGIISNTVSNEHSKKEEFIDSYFKKIDKKNLTEIAFRTNNVKDYKGREINNIVNISSGEFQVIEHHPDSLLIQLDTNNRTLLTNKSEWLDILEHLFDSSSPKVAEQVAIGA